MYEERGLMDLLFLPCVSVCHFVMNFCISHSKYTVATPDQSIFSLLLRPPPIAVFSQNIYVYHKKGK